MEFGKGFGHEFIDFFVNKFMFVITQHILELVVTVGNGGKRHLRSLNANKGQVLVLTHFNEIARITVRLLGFLEIFLLLLIPLFGLGQSRDIHSHIHQELDISLDGKLIIGKDFLDLVEVLVNKLHVGLILFS